MSTVDADRDLRPGGFAGVSRSVILTLGSAALILGLALGTVLLPRSMSAEQYVALGYYPLNQAKKVEIESLTTHTEASFLTDDLTGHWSLLFFGYSYCPDVCPTTLSVLNRVARELSALGSADQPQIIMVTVDPDRDTAAQLAAYVPYFNPAFVGVTGEVDAILNLTSQLNIGFEKVTVADRDPESTAASSYEIAHSTQIVVVNPDGYYTGMLTAPHQPERIVKVLTSLMGE